MTAGRPRQFDYDDALEKAMHVFWSKGFEGTSMPDLTEAMGMNRPSIYAAFGNKEELFRKALERYTEQSLAAFRDLLDAPTVREGLERLFCGSADKFACKERPRGCLAVQGALVGSADAANVCADTAKQREAMVDVLRERFERGLKEGDLKAGTDTAGLARFYVTILQGMAVQSASGVACADLKAIAHRALEALPVA
jgi:AcrR family transcriptional regulator